MSEPLRDTETIRAARLETALREVRRQLTLASTEATYGKTADGHYIDRCVSAAQHMIDAALSVSPAPTLTEPEEQEAMPEARADGDPSSWPASGSVSAVSPAPQERP